MCLVYAITVLIMIDEFPINIMFDMPRDFAFYIKFCISIDRYYRLHRTCISTVANIENEVKTGITYVLNS